MADLYISICMINEGELQGIVITWAKQSQALAARFELLTFCR